MNKFLDAYSMRALQDKIKLAVESFTTQRTTVDLVDSSHGHLSTSIALKQDNPKEFAERLVQKLQEIFSNLDLEINIAPSGFINFIVQKHLLIAGLKEIIIMQEDYGKPMLKAKISIDHTDVNPTGMPHAGHARLAVIGDVVCRFLLWCGGNVHRDYLLNDCGNQINALLESVKVRIAQLNGDVNIIIPKDGYHGDYLIKVAQDAINQKISDQNLLEFALNSLNDTIMSDLSALNVHFDLITAESDLQRHDMDNVIKLLSKEIYYGKLPKPKSHEGEWDPQDTLLLRRYANQQTEEDIPLRKNNGDWTYFAGDTAFHLRRINRGASWLINVFGSDHENQAPKLQRCLDVICPDQNRPILSFVWCQIVSLVKDGNQIKMSKRAGNYLTLKDLLNELQPDILRVAMLTRSSNSPLTIDVNLFQSMSEDNPYYYLQYAYARTCSVIRMAEKLYPDILLDHCIANLDLLDSKEELEHIYKLLRWPTQVERLLSNISTIHQLLIYARMIANSFHVLWSSGSAHQTKKFILPDNLEISRARLALVYATQQTLHSIFNIVGITPLTSL